MTLFDIMLLAKEITCGQMGGSVVGLVGVRKVEGAGISNSEYRSWV